MTTNKRFILDDDGIVTDMIDLSLYIDNEDCCEKLNELHEEKEQLKKENKESKQKIESLKMEIAELRESEKDNYNISDGLW